MNEIAQQPPALTNMSETKLPASKTADESRPASLPRPGDLVMVQCKSFRCLGYLDPKGKWRDSVQFKELSEVIGWVRI